MRGPIEAFETEQRIGQSAAEAFDIDLPTFPAAGQPHGFTFNIGQAHKEGTGRDHMGGFGGVAGIERESFFTSASRNLSDDFNRLGVDLGELQIGRARFVGVEGNHRSQRDETQQDETG